MLYPDLVSSINFAQQQGLSVGIYPTPHFPEMSRGGKFRPVITIGGFFFERYSNFILHHASKHEHECSYPYLR
jgi:hypothetical protein